MSDERPTDYRYSVCIRYSFVSGWAECVGWGVKFELTAERIEEMVFCIVDNNLDRDEAIRYAMDFVADCQCEDAEGVGND